MASYRFCRPDNIPSLVRAINECYAVHRPRTLPMTVERFRAEMKSIDVWPSNSMVALSGTAAVAVMIGTKRPREVMVLRLGVHPDHLRQGHGSHMLTSLSHKLAVLGPERLIAEVPAAMADVGRFFESVGFRREATYTDYVREPATVESVPAEWVIRVSVDDLVDAGLLQPTPGVAWERAHETLVNCRSELQGVAFASPERLEAFLLYRPTDGTASLDVVAAGGRDSEQLELFLSFLLRHLAGKNTLPLRIPKLADGELPSALLSTLGFKPCDRYDCYTITATPT